MDTQIKNIIEKSYSKSDVARALKLPLNSKGLKKVDEIIKQYNTSHFDSRRACKMRAKYEKIEKICPICGNKFITLKGHKKEKITCSHSCSNTYNRSGENHPNYIDGHAGNAFYRKICFKHHNKECVICLEKNIIEVHHYDGNHNNIKPENLIPLCPTHHRYWHSKYRILIKDKIDNYIFNFKLSSGVIGNTSDFDSGEFRFDP